MENQEVVVDVTKKLILTITLLSIIVLGYSQGNTTDASSSVYKKRVLENIEIDF